MKKLSLMTYRGFSLLEVLVATAIAGVILIGNLHSLNFAMQAGAVSKAILNENDFKLTLSNAIRENCDTNLMPTAPQITGTHKEKGIGQVSKLFLKGEGTDYENDPAIIKLSPETFKGDIEVVKMELTGEDSENTAGGGFFKRDFVAYYKKTNLGDLNTVAGKPCTASDTAGCFTTQCKLDYEFGDDPETETTTETGHFRGCKSLTCHPVVLQVAGSRFPCKWGELYRPGATPKCDKRENQTGGCDNPTGSKFLKRLGGDTTGRVNENGKCVCPKDGTVKRVLTAEGLCIKKQQEYNWFSCWPRTTENHNVDGGAPIDHLYQDSIGATEENIKDFCSNKYQGQEVCIRSEGKTGNALEQSICKKLKPGSFERSYYKRVYNRETGQVSCLRFIQCQEGPSPTEAAKDAPPAGWLMPQIQ